MAAKIVAAQKYNREKIVLYSVVALLMMMIVYQQYYVIGLKQETLAGFSRLEQSVGELSSNLNTKINKVAEDNQKGLGQVAGSVRELDAKLASVEQSSTSQLAGLKKELSTVKSASGDFSGVIQEVIQGVVSVDASGSLGSGAVIDEDGYVVTNYHVVDGASRYRVLTQDGKIHTAALIGYSQPYDVAMLKIPSGYPALDYGDSDGLQVGQKVIAVGNPLGLSFSVTEGIVSGLNRGRENFPGSYIQTDVSINPGNSGGPLINQQGEIIGLNNFKISGETIEGLGFALESNDARKITDGLIAGFEAGAPT